LNLSSIHQFNGPNHGDRTVSGKRQVLLGRMPWLKGPVRE